MKIVLQTNKCIQCGACVILCPQKAISLAEGEVQINQALCSQCKICISKCYSRALIACSQ